jgi:NTE family protein
MKKFFTLLLLSGFLGSSLPADEGVIFPTGVTGQRLATEALWHNFLLLPKENRPRIVLVLGGGGARGLSHIGVLRVLEQEKIPIDEIVGVSVGSLIGALYAANVPIKDMESMAVEVGWNKLTNISKVGVFKMILAESLFSTKRMETYLTQHIGGKNFEDLKIPFMCVATDLRTGEAVIFHEGAVAVAARASATIPGIFSPVDYRHRSLVDGGLVDNLPIDLARAAREDVIVIGVLPRANEQKEEINTVFKTLVRSIEIQRDSIIETKKKSADFMIEPFVGAMSIADLDRTEECIDAGILAGRETALDLKSLILSRTLKFQKRVAASER